jgi:S1-C subfamily serine protease
VIHLKGPLCKLVDIPRDSVQRINSTYVAATNPVPNPEYTQLQSQLASAEADLNRAASAQTLDPNFWTGFALGRARGKVNRIQQALARTAPYISEDILQQYQYERYAAYRAYTIKATIQINIDKQFVTEATLSGTDEQRASGNSGVLPQDHTGVRNQEALLISVQESAERASAEFVDKLNVAVREAGAEYLGALALDHDIDPVKRLGALLYFREISLGTKYTYNSGSAALTEALLNGGSSVTRFLDSLQLPIPVRVISQTTVTAQKLDLDRAITGVVSIETDANKSGSGFFGASGCLVITNAHVVEMAEAIIVRDYSKKIYVAQVLAKDLDRDLALLSTTARSCTVLPLGNSDARAIGQDVYAIGNPLGLTGTVTKGIISAFRSVSGVSYIQIDATINPGNSGGPLLAVDGNVLGVATFKLKGFEGLNFAVSSNEVKLAFSQFLH